jgi:thioredoxin-dependent peroxiredoxin
VQILGVSFDTVADNAAFARKFDFPFPLLCDTGREIGLAYHACDDPKAGFARRISYVIDPAGKIERAYDKVEAGRHPGQVLQDLAQEQEANKEK